jgi:lysophospholipase L1-like esterase
MVLQPSMAFKQPLAPEERAFTAYAYREPVMKALYDRAAADLNRLAARDQIAFLDARTIYDGLTAPLFSDDVHFRSKEGYEILARAIAAALPADAIGAAHP